MRAARFIQLIRRARDLVIRARGGIILRAAPTVWAGDEIAIRGGTVVGAAVGRPVEVELRDHWVLPAMVNAHDHLHLNCFPPLRAGRYSNSYQWISDFNEKMRDPEITRLKRIPVETRLWHGGLKNLLCGAMTVAHHDPWSSLFDYPGFPVSVPNIGWAHSPGLSPDLGPPEGMDGLPRYGPEVVESYRRRQQDRPWMIHAAEGVDSVAAAEISTLESWGCLGPNSVLAHAVGAGAADVDRIIASGAGVAWCPSSNLLLFGRTLNPRQLADAGRLAIGTDSRLTGGRDLLDELRCAAGATCSPAGLAPWELFRMATIDSARILRISGAGELASGWSADLIVLRRRSDNPFQDVIGANRGDLRAIVRGGEAAVADADLEELFEGSSEPPVRITLDGIPKLCARSVISKPEAVALEPGLCLS